MHYTLPMDLSRFDKLADELADRDDESRQVLPEIWAAADELQGLAGQIVARFRARVRARGCEHLAKLEVGAVEPDEKRVNAVQFKVRRGRWEIVCVAKSKGGFTLVGPYRCGKPEKPCADFPLRGAELEGGLEEKLEALIREASAV